MSETRARTLQAGAVAVGDGLPLYVRDLETAVLDIAIAGVATVVFEVQQLDTGAWASISGVDISDNGAATSATVSGVYRFDVAGFYAIRARISAWTSGAVTVEGTATGGGVSLADVVGIVMSEYYRINDPLRIANASPGITLSKTGEDDWFLSVNEDNELSIRNDNGDIGLLIDVDGNATIGGAFVAVGIGTLVDQLGVTGVLPKIVLSQTGEDDWFLAVNGDSELEIRNDGGGDVGLLVDIDGNVTTGGSLTVADGVTGTFTTVDSKTVTVVNGIVIGIA